MVRKFRRLEGACTPFPGHPADPAGTHLPNQMDLLVQEQGLLLPRDLADKSRATDFFELILYPATLMKVFVVEVPL